MLKRSIAIVSSTAVLALLAVPSAEAQDPELDSYGAGASATALHLSLGGEDLTFSGTSAAVGSKPEAAADGQAVTTPLFSTPGAPVTSTGALITGEDCVLDEDLPAPINLAGLEVSCVRTSAEVADDAPEGMSTSDEIVIQVLDSELVDQVSADVLGPALEQLLTGLQPLLDELGLTENVDAFVALALADLENNGTVSTVRVAPTSSTATKVSSRASSQGVTVELLPDLILGLGPLATVVVGDSFASAAYDPVTDEVSIDGKAAFLSVDLTALEVVLTVLVGSVEQAISDAVVSQLPDPLPQLLADVLAEALALVNGLDTQIEDTVNVTVDQLACPDSPLAALLCFSAGGVNELDAAGLEAHGFTFGDGTRGIEAEVLGLSVLDGTLELGIGQAAAGANGSLATPPVTPPQTPDEDRSLPTTGGEVSLPLTMALLAAAGAGLFLVRRTRPI